MRFTCGLSNLGLIQIPPCTATEATPMSAMVPASGSTSVNADRPASMATAMARPGSGFSMTLPTSTIAVRATSKSPWKTCGSRKVAARKPSHIPSSGVLPICPSCRAFFRRFGVAFSVLSPPPPPLIGRPPRPERRPSRHRPDQVIGLAGDLDHDLRHQAEADADEQERQADLEREAEREGVELGRDAVEHAEGDVRDEQHDDQRPGDLQSGDEQPVEPVDEMAVEVGQGEVTVGRQGPERAEEALEDQ